MLAALRKPPDEGSSGPVTVPTLCERRQLAGGHAASRRTQMADHQPSFGTALVAVLAGGVVSSWISALFIGFAPATSPEAWAIVTSLAGGVGVKAVLRVLHYEVPFAFAAGAVL